MINIIRGASEKYVSTNNLVEYFESRGDLEGTLYIGYPIIGSIDGAFDIDAMLISKQHGVVIFDFVEGKDAEGRDEIRDDLYMKTKAKLTDYKSLVAKRELKVCISVITYATAVHKSEDEEVIVNSDDLTEFLNTISWTDSENYYYHLLQSVQAITKIRPTINRNKVQREDSKGAILKKLEESIANLDANQSEAVIETAEGPQRIRGLAGSGKTIVLALKVAYLHSKNPDWKIAVTFNTRSLKKQFEELITKFTYEHKRDEPDWEKIEILQAWGSPSNSGIYYEVCKEHNIEYLDFRKAKNQYIFSDNPFQDICKKAIDEISNFTKMYDVILIDEAQDFSSEFLKLCYEILDEPKRLIFAYDELQTLNKNSMPSPEEIFGEDTEGNPRVVLRNEKDKPKQDIMLKVCYRNSRPILATAHALGFGIYRNPEKGIIQMFDDQSLWMDVGYEVVKGSLEDGKYVELERSAESSPRFLEMTGDVSNIIEFICFDNQEQQDNWVYEQIQENISRDELNHQDIMVIHTDPLTTQNKVSNIRKKLYENGVNSHVAGAANPDLFNAEKSVTFTGIYRAKGNEAGMVYVLNAQNCYDGHLLSKKRNILFTAITRSRGWVRVVGFGEHMQHLKEEFEKVKQNDYILKFTYPNEEERKKMNVIHRDKTKDEQIKIEKNINHMIDFIQDLHKGEMYLEDLPEEVREKLKGLFE
ncbi:TPA: DEAD/DEAH box helicase [Bacillus tropicus]|nr:DEAD/DEAH box helicase [Bacillus tropicus]